MNIRNISLTLLFMLMAFTPSMFAAPSGESEMAPSFSLVDYDGKTRTLDEFKGKIVVLEWTNPNCPVVVRHYANGAMQKLQKTYAEKGIVWLTVNSTNPNHQDHLTGEEQKAKYAEWKASPTAQLIDADGKVGREYGARTTPHIFIIDTESKLAYRGAVDDDPRGKKEQKVNYVSAALEALLAGKAVEVSSTQPYGCSVKYGD